MSEGSPAGGGDAAEMVCVGVRHSCLPPVGIYGYAMWGILCYAHVVMEEHQSVIISRVQHNLLTAFVWHEMKLYILTIYQKRRMRDESRIQIQNN